MIHKAEFTEVYFLVFVELSRKIRTNSDIWIGTSLYYTGTDYVGNITIECNSEKKFREAIRLFNELLCSLDS